MFASVQQGGSGVGAQEKQKKKHRIKNKHGTRRATGGISTHAQPKNRNNFNLKLKDAQRLAGKNQKKPA